MATTNLSITPFSVSGGVMDCYVYSAFPLYIGELFINPSTGYYGRVNPGTRANPGLRTIYLPSGHAVFSKPLGTPFTLTVTYDANYDLTNATALVRAPGEGTASDLLELLEPTLSSTDQEERIVFVTELLARIGVLAEPAP